MLAYQFRAFFVDGTTYDQAPDDEARLADHGSAFSDVLHLLAQGAELSAFALCGPDGQPVAAVHLDTGHFELGGHEFWSGEGLPATKPELVYYRLVTRTRSQDVDATTFEPLSEWSESVHTRYVIGWEADGVRHVIGLDG
jgi:hypothetical protein